MNKKNIKYVVLPILAAVIFSTSAVSAYGGFGGGFGRMANLEPEEIAERKEAMFASKADFLGISVEDVKDAWAGGKSLLELAEENGITRETLQAQMQEKKREAMEEHLASLVSEGVITQTQADERRAWMEERTESGEFGPGNGYRKGGFGKGLNCNR